MSRMTRISLIAVPLVLLAAWAFLVWRFNTIWPLDAPARRMQRAMEPSRIDALRGIVQDGQIDTIGTFGYASMSDTRTPLMHAAETCACDAVRELVASGADVHARSRLSQNALDLAVRGNCPCAVTQLIAAGLDPLGPAGTMTPFDAAVAARKAECIQAILNAVPPAIRSELEARAAPRKP